MYYITILIFLLKYIVNFDTVLGEENKTEILSVPEQKIIESISHAILTSDTTEPKSQQHDRDIASLKDTIKALNDQLQSFNSLYIGRLDQKMMAIVSNMASIDSNVKNIQERAHVWDTFQLHVSAWNDQIKSLDRKVDIINSGQEKMSLLESKLSILLNLEYNSARIVNKLTSIEDRLEQVERTLRRQQSDISSISQRDGSTESLLSRNLPGVIKAIDKKTDRLIGIIQRNTPLGRRFARGNGLGNDTHSPPRIIIKCTTPPTVEEIVKDVASKVDLIYDKIISDNISYDCNSEEDRKNIDNSDEIEEDRDHDYSLLVFNSNEDDSEEKQFKRQSRHIHDENLSKLTNITRTKRSQLDSINSACGDIGEVKSLITKLPISVSKLNNEAADNIIETIKKLLNENVNNKITSTNIDRRITQLYMNLNYVCAYLQDTITSGFQSELKRYCHIILSSNKNEKIDKLTMCLRDTGYMTTSSENTTNKHERSPINSNVDTDIVQSDNNQTKYYNDFKPVCQKYFESFERMSIRDVDNPEQLTCFIVGSHIKNMSIELCADPKPRFCDENRFLIFQSRVSELVTFSRSWNEYKWGFGDMKSGNYWIGNEALHLLTKKSHPAILKINLEDFNGDTAWAEYDTFKISTETEGYRIWVSGYRGNSSDSLAYHSGAAFSTVDERFDEAPPCCPCANSYGRGGWWYRSCFESNLNGIYFNPPREPLDGGITWESWRPNSTLSKTTMAIGFLNSSTIKKYDTEDP